MRSNHPDAAKWGSLALVSYIPDPLGTFLLDLQRLLPGEHNPQPHVTILPPRPLRAGIEAVTRDAKNTLQRFPSFDVELSQVRCFPETSIFYLDVSEGQELLYALHRALNAGELAHTERFEFLPHLTLGGPVPGKSSIDLRQRAESLWRSAICPVRFHVSEVVCLWLPPGAAWRNWERVWSQSLAGGNAAASKEARAALSARTY